MKKKLSLLAMAAVIAASAAQAQSASEFRIYLNPGHGSFTSNDRPMNTIGHPNTTSLTDTLGFYEGRGTLPRSLYIGHTLQQMGVKPENIVFSRTKNGPWPKDSESSTKYNRNLSEICEEVEAGNFDMFLASHSDANDNTKVNYPTYLYRGQDSKAQVEGSREMALANHPYHLAPDLENYSRTAAYVKGDWDYYGSYTTTTRNNGKQYTGYLAVLKHGTPGYLLEGFFHTYAPARHRALNFDYDREEGLREARGIGAYFGFPQLTTGAVLGTVRDAEEVMTHSLYGYREGTDDQYKPLNGATVKLVKDGTVVKTYQTDQEWNGIFAFFDVEPGTYQLQASCAGYRSLEPVEITVTANATTYPKLHLNAGTVDPLSQITFNQEPETTYEMTGTVAQTLQHGDNTIVLTHSGKNANLYLVDNTTKQIVKNISTSGVYVNESNPGFYNQLGSIALTADGKLVGVSSVRNSFDASFVESGYQQGTLYGYLWDNFDAAPAQFFTTQNSTNYYNADMGYAVAVNGPSTACTVSIVGVTSGDSRAIRVANVAIAGGAVTKTWHVNTNATLNAVSMGDPAQGGKLHLAVSPLGSNNYVMGGSKGTVVEFPMPTTAAAVPASYTYLAASHAARGAGFSFLDYNDHKLMVAPYGASTVQGLKLIDVTDGLNKAMLVSTVNTDVASSSPVASAAYSAAGAWADGDDIYAYLTGDNSIIKFTTKSGDSPEPPAGTVVKGIYAYGLDVAADGGNYTFSFTANSDAVKANLIFYDAATGAQVGSVELNDVKEGTNTAVVAKADLPGNPGQQLNWAVALKGYKVTEFKRLNDFTNFTFTRAALTVDKNPESMFFGNLYVGDRTGASAASNGLFAYNPDWTRINSSVLKKRDDGKNFANNYRISVDGNGLVYVSDWGDAASGVFVADPADFSAGFKSFFRNANGSFLSRASSGLLTNASGESVASSAPSVWIQGTGADTKMYVYNEDMGNIVSRYDIGTADHWNQAPSFNYNIGSLQANGNGNVIADDEGNIWVAQTRAAGQNTATIPSLIYVDKNGNVLYNSGNDPNINGSGGSGFAISNDGKTLVINEPTGTLKFFDIKWNGATPSLDYKFEYPCDAIDGSKYIYEMAFDYGGNLIAGGSKVGIYSIPSDVNENTTPARKALIVEKPGYHRCDVNRDGSVDVQDISCVLGYALCFEGASDYDGRVDVNGDGDVDVADINNILFVALGQ